MFVSHFLAITTLVSAAALAKPIGDLQRREWKVGPKMNSLQIIADTSTNPATEKYVLTIDGKSDASDLPPLNCTLGPIGEDKFVNNTELTCTGDANSKLYLSKPMPLRAESKVDNSTHRMMLNLVGSDGQLYANHIDNIFTDGRINCDAQVPPFTCNMKEGQDVGFTLLREITTSVCDSFNCGWEY